ncbi:hypothetical protein [Ligilactobacillus equi]|nr:hypothetical protein [Ligilactobacillus equi]KRL78111.1 hypothetical protein FC36_GL001161 [Ligilactobacillus equi DSM 15833 = JCM 10991]
MFYVYNTITRKVVSQASNSKEARQTALKLQQKYLKQHNPNYIIEKNIPSDEVDRILQIAAFSYCDDKYLTLAKISF